NSLSHRMMDTVIRDIDIVASKSTGPQDKHNLYRNGQKIEKAYYVASNSNGVNHTGDGTESNPYSFEQLAAINCDDAIVSITTGDREITKREYRQLKGISNLAGHGSDIELTAGGNKVLVQDKDSVSISVEGGEKTTLLDSVKHKAVKVQKVSSVLRAYLRFKNNAARAEVERAEAAAKLQSLARMARAKAEFAKKKAVATKIKSIFRGNKTRAEARTEAAAAAKLQSLARMARAKAEFTKKKEAATKIKSVFRGHEAKAEFAKKKAAATKIQSIFRGCKVRVDEVERARPVDLKGMLNILRKNAASLGLDYLGNELHPILTALRAMINTDRTESLRRKTQKRFFDAIENRLGSMSAVKKLEMLKVIHYRYVPKTHQAEYNTRVAALRIKLKRAI
ncbi:MAG: hypothetical protein P8P83_06005, partial [Rickettsiaceae bacterium]|nr:hypothetical protein [Rickettsiaceae bacterium]